MEPIARVPVVQQAEIRIAQMIKDEALPAGSKLPSEMSLCQTLQVGRGTVREALRLLQAKGIVEIRPGKGAFVAGKNDGADLDAIHWLVQNVDTLRDALDVRMALEPMAARLTALRCSREELHQLEQTHKAFLQAVNDRDARRIGQLDEVFHTTIVSCCGNPLMQEIYTRICEGMKIFRAKTFQVEQNVRNAVMPHSNIFNAIMMGDADQAEWAMRTHLEKAQEDLIQNIQEIRQS